MNLKYVQPRCEVSFARLFLTSTRPRLGHNFVDRKLLGEINVLSPHTNLNKYLALQVK